MPSPFPGMDPYLEHSELWAEVHSRLIVNLADFLGPQLRPKYRVAVEKRTYTDLSDAALVGLPDVAVVSRGSTTNQNSSTTSSTATVLTQNEPVTVRIPMPEEVKESYLEIREIGTGAVVTAIEILSPKNKRAVVGRQAYSRKRLEVLGSFTHLVEIDLLRRGKPMLIWGERPRGDYNILISRSDKRPLAQLYRFGVREKIPVFPLPLTSTDVEPIVDLQELFTQVYDRASFDLAVDYGSEPVPPLKADDAAWAATLLQESGWR
ncbi:DUF4058 family protein [Coleofasciculus sp. E2-BRE-01]|uniref:DUF4058 family protein n=1 Tax=Coleofasciculus sp. E2-BRE-01 TaxID=3069524 RepID=UPI0032F74DEE